MTNPAFPRLSTTKLGENKDAPRVWLEGLYLLDAGFTPARRVEVEFAPGRVTIRTAVTGSRVVSSKRQGRIPVLDLNSSALRDAFGNVSVLQVTVNEGEIVLSTALTEVLRRTRCRNGKEGSAFSGGGLLSEAARQAGFEPAFAIEVDPNYAALYSANHPQSKMFNMSVADVPVEDLPAVELLTLGIPCQPYSRSRTKDRITGAKRDHSLPPEAHELSDLSIWAAMLIRRLNPATVIIEEAPDYLNSASGWMMKFFLERAGYKVEAQVLDPRQYGELSGRRRTVIIAHSDDVFRWPLPQPCTRTLGDIMEPLAAVESEFFTAEQKPWLIKHWEEQDRRGNGFRPPELTEKSTTVPTLKLRYFSGQGDGMVISHPVRSQCWRWLTIGEAKRLHGVPDSYYLGEDQSKTRAGEVLGQGVIVSFFRRIIAAATGRLVEMATDANASPSPATSARETDSFVLPLPQLALAF